MRAKYVVLLILIAVFIILVLIDRKIKLNKKKQKLEDEAMTEKISDEENESVSE